MHNMRIVVAVAAWCAAFVPSLAQAAKEPETAKPSSNWQALSVEQGKRIELDRTSIKKDGAKTTAWGRIVLDRELHDAKSGGAYKTIEAMNRYNCEAKTYATTKRVYIKSEGEVLREEENSAQADQPVRAGSLEEKLMKEVCRPQSPSEQFKLAQKTADRVAAATFDLKEANEERLKKEAEKDKAAGKKKVDKSALKEEDSKADKGEKDDAAPAPSLVGSRSPSPVRKPLRLPVKKSEKNDKGEKGDKSEKTDKMDAAARPPGEVHWSYEGETGPDNWAKLSPEFAACAKGQRQSPINIHDGIRVDQPPLVFSYGPTFFREVDNGHTIQIMPGGSKLTLIGKTYELVNLHFHRPSEERVNGQAYDMVAHLVHKAADGKLAVVAVLLEIGKPNPVIKTLWDYLPLEIGEEVAPPDVSIDLNQLLPESRAYYTFMGSLTTPPCTEGVLWIVLKQPMTIGANQADIFARLYRNNTRPIQPLNGRLIKESN